LSNNKKSRTFWVLFGFFTGLLTAVLIAANPPALTGEQEPGGIYRNLNIFAKVLAYIQNNYVDKVEDEKLIHAAIRGMVGTLDPHSMYLTPDMYKEIKDETSGEFGGVGMEIAIKGNFPVVVAPIAGSPADKAGIKPEDRIVEIEGKNIRDMDIIEVSKMLKGPPGTKVNLSVIRDPQGETIKFVLIREKIRVPSVEFRLLEPGYGYIRIKSFQEQTTRQVEDALKKLGEMNKKSLKGLVLDLRNNPGGLFDQAVKVSDLFMNEGLIVSTEGRDKKEENREYAHPMTGKPRYPIAVLINGGSASASEIVAGAFQDSKRATIVGTPSFGKGSVQTMIELEDHSALKLTIAKYYTPKHRSIQDQGIIPDIEIDEPEQTVAIKTGTSPGQTSPVPQITQVPIDVQLKAAMDHLKKMKK